VPKARLRNRLTGEISWDYFALSNKKIMTGNMWKKTGTCASIFVSWFSNPPPHRQTDRLPATPEQREIILIYLLYIYKYTPHPQHFITPVHFQSPRKRYTKIMRQKYKTIRCSILGFNIFLSFEIKQDIQIYSGAITNGIPEDKLFLRVM